MTQIALETEDRPGSNGEVSHPEAVVVLKTEPASEERHEPLLDPGLSLKSVSSRRIRVRDEDGLLHVARVHGGEDSGAVILPDGRIACVQSKAYTEEPFVPWTKEQLRSSLGAGPYHGFAVHETEHYLVFFQGSEEFARSSGRLLESLYRGLLEGTRHWELQPREAEFPLVAVIYADEEAFRAANRVAPDVEAYFDVTTNRIHLYESSIRDREAPDLASRRKPQTVAHEGTHQVLQNIGIHPRLASWPSWLVEGLAEFFAPTTVRPGDTWNGANHVNPFHMATLRELDDPIAAALKYQGRPIVHVDRKPGCPLVEYVVTKTELSPTDYAIAWALTHFLFNTQPSELRAYLCELRDRETSAEAGPTIHLQDFRRHFGTNLTQMDRSIGRYLSRLKESEPLAHYAVLFEQSLSPTVIRRAAFVSQSPALIRQWLEEATMAPGGPAQWRAISFPTRSRAVIMAESWLGGSR